MRPLKKKDDSKPKKAVVLKPAKKRVVETEAPKYKDLRQIMNYKVPFEMIYSGVENELYFNILYSKGIRNFLMSYHYVQSKHLSFQKRFEGLESIRLFIDSGAHTYQNDIKYQETTVEEWEKHLQGYLRWAEKNRDYIFAIASFDFENLVSPETVDRWNKEYFEPFMLRTGIPVCFVWHQNSHNSWEYYCKRYPYVGFSSVNTEGVAIDLNEYKDKLKVAEKHDSVVHGFGMTRTSMLTELPFYTSDSTTWLVGLQYGEVNYWRQTKMSRLKKEQWKGEYLDDICNRYGLDREKMLNEENTELIIANICAFIEAEEYIKTRLKSFMYWLKARAVKVDLDNLPDDFFPSPEWFNGDCSDASEYASKMNLNPEYQVVDMLYDVTCFMNWENPEYEELVNWYYEPAQQGLIDNLHDTYINRIVGSEEDKIQDLIQFFSDCVSGKNDKLLQLGTNFDRVVKERDQYIEDNETELVDLTPEELRVKLHGLLPPPEDYEEGAPEVDILNEEIYRQADIVPTFDDKGRFVKGQKAVRKPKQVYSKKFPKVACDTCHAGARCAEFKAGHVCAYHKMFNQFDFRDMADIIQAVQGMVGHNFSRMQRSMVIETLNGNIDGTVTSLMDQNMKYLMMMKQLYDTASPEVLRQTRIIRADGSQEETTQITNPQSGSILERLFSDMGSKKSSDDDDIIDSEVVDKSKNERYDVTDEDE